MDGIPVDDIQKELDLRETEDLVGIWQEHDRDQWSEAAFVAIHNILINRLGKLPSFDQKDGADEYIRQAEEFLEAEEYYKAFDKINLAVKLAPHYGYAHYIKGLVFDEMENLEEAVKCYEEALRLSPKLDDARMCLAWASDDLAKKNTQLDERILAALAHGSIIVSVVGLLVPAIIWITQRQKSRFVAFQSLQAIIFQTLAAFIQLVSGLLSFIRLAASMIKTPWLSSMVQLVTTASQQLICISSIMYFISFLFVVFGVIAAISTLRGKPFAYSRWIRKFTNRLLQP
jgi:uncharacterized Tic20 family protein